MSLRPSTSQMSLLSLFYFRCLFVLRRHKCLCCRCSTSGVSSSFDITNVFVVVVPLPVSLRPSTSQMSLLSLFYFRCLFVLRRHKCLCCRCSTSGVSSSFDVTNVIVVVVPLPVSLRHSTSQLVVPLPVLSPSFNITTPASSSLF